MDKLYKYKYNKYKTKHRLTKSKNSIGKWRSTNGEMNAIGGARAGAIPKGGECDGTFNCRNYTVSWHGCETKSQQLLDIPEVTLYFYANVGRCTEYDEMPNVCCNRVENCDPYKSGAKPYREKINYGTHYNDIRLTKKHDVRNGFVDCLNTATKGYLHLAGDYLNDVYINSVSDEGILLSDVIKIIYAYHKYMVNGTIPINIHVSACRTPCN